MRKKLQELETVLRREIKRAERQANSSKRAAYEIARAAASSWSMAGDRTHAEGQAQIAEENLAKLKKLMEEIKLSMKKFPEKIELLSFIVATKNGEREEDFYLVQTPVFIKGFTLVSTESPFGQAILNKRVGDTFKYKVVVDGQKKAISGKIISIE